MPFLERSGISVRSREILQILSAFSIFSFRSVTENNKEPIEKHQVATVVGERARCNFDRSQRRVCWCVYVAVIRIGASGARVSCCIATPITTGSLPVSALTLTEHVPIVHDDDETGPFLSVLGTRPTTFPLNQSRCEISCSIIHTHLPDNVELDKHR